MLRAISAFVLVLTGCDSADQTIEKGKQAAGDLATAAGDKAKQAADGAGDKSKELAADALARSKTLAGDAVEAGKGLWADLPGTGELSTSAMGWLERNAEGTSIEQVVVTGTQIAPVAMQISGVVSAAVDKDTAIEPIYEKIEDTAAVDKAVGDMPRVEVIDGVTVGYKRMEDMTSKTSVSEEAYLMTWRRGDHLVGLVYRSRSTIDIEMLVKETPRLVRLVQSVIG
jgi:hypothetical protein